MLIRMANPEKYILDFIQKLNLTYSFFLQNELRNHAAAGAYYMLLSLIPLILLLVYIFDTFLVNYPSFSQDLFTVLSIFNENLSPEMFDKLGISKKAGSAIGLFGLVNLLFSSRLILSSIQRAFGVIFPAEKRRNFLMENFISLGIIPVVFVIVLIVGVLSSTKLILFKYLQINGVSTYYIEPIINVASYVIPGVIAFIVVYFTYRYLPMKRPSSRSAIKGSVLFLVVFVLARFLAYSIIKNIASNTAYGLIGSLIVVLVWSYIVFLLFFFCAQYVFVTYRADILILNKLFSDTRPSNKFIILNKKILEKYTREIDKGEVLFNLGDDSDSVYYLMNGELDVIVRDKNIGNITEGEVFGEMAHLTGEVRSATVKAKIDSELIILPAKVFDEIIKDNPELSRRLMQTLCERLKKAQFMGRFSG